jgi:rhodanese-related sulfurtransferase
MVLGDPPAANGGGAAPPLVADAPVKVAAMSPGELKARLGTVVVLDVRTALEDVAMGHIPGAVRLSKDDILLQIGKERPIVVVCLSGHRSPPMAEWLVAHGYGEVYDLTGGLLAWKGAGYPVSREASTPPSWP